MAADATSLLAFDQCAIKNKNKLLRTYIAAAYRFLLEEIEVVYLPTIFILPNTCLLQNDLAIFHSFLGFWKSLELIAFPNNRDAFCC